VLIVANQTIGGAELAAAVSDRVRTGSPCSFHLLVPVPPTPPPAIAVGLAAAESAATTVMDLPDQREVARERLACGLDWLGGLGATATGGVTTEETVDAVLAVARERDVDEIIVSTLPSRLSRWLRQDLPSRLARRTDLPIVVVTARIAPGDVA
jgi:GABA permease